MMLVGLGSKVIVEKQEWVVGSIRKDGITLCSGSNKLQFTLREFESMIS